MTNKEFIQEKIDHWKMLLKFCDTEEKHKRLFNEIEPYESVLKDLERLEQLEKENEALKIHTLLKNKEGYIKSKKGTIMKLRISSITYNGTKFMVSGYCMYSENCRCLPLNKVYLNEEVLEDA